jgi:multiple sugar transport system substrate-binding protein
MALLMIVLIAGCGQGSSGSADNGAAPSGQQPNAGKSETASPPPAPVSKDPITLKFYMHVLLPDEDYKFLIEAPVKKKFPNITLDLIKKTGSVEGDIQNLLASGTTPDLTYTSSLHLHYFKDFKVPADLEPMVKQYKTDLNRFEPRAIEAIRSYGDKGQLYALPFALNHSALYYNKDIFDKFAVPYPKDGMTWKEVIELAKRVARTADGVQYKGIDPLSITTIASPLSLPMVDAKTGKAALESDGWKRGLELLQQITKIPGNEKIGGIGTAQFEKEKILAMLAHPLGRIPELQANFEKGDKLNWDMASFPVYEGHPGTSMQLDAHVMLVSETSKHKNEAFQILSLLTADDAQLASTKAGRLSSLKDAKFKQAYGENLSVLKGKNVQGIFKNTPAPFARPSEFDSAVTKILNKAAADVMAGKSDVNTALRLANEAANQAIAAEKTK